ncbi:RNA-directed DNA polymerase from mobile element jockey [Trichonephila clavipes]|nr:RNA-directed DNA polymerase from mobile element jockey [Trichonephila clavipes]
MIPFIKRFSYLHLKNLDDLQPDETEVKGIVPSSRYNLRARAGMTGPTQPQAGVELQSSLKIVFLITMSPPRPRFGIASATIIDYALIKNLNWPGKIDSISELSSDHNPIKLHFPKTANFELPPPQLNTNWNIFTKTLANTENLYLPQASSTSEIESQVRELSSEILNAHVKASRPTIHSEPPYVQGMGGSPYFLDAEDGSLWEPPGLLRKKASPISALNGPNGIALSDSNKTDLIAQSLESQFQLNNIHNPQKDQIISSIVDAYINDHTNTTDAIQPALPSEIINYIKKIKIKKSPGRDGITNKMIKNLPLITVFKITNIINNMFKLRNFPNAWKTAVIIPILKPGKNPKLAESYRPISLLPILSKLAEKIISTRLNAFLESENILARVPEQHGFRPRLSTSHQLLRVVEYIKDAIDRNQHVAAVFLDIQKAFDRVWHTGLLVKLITYKIPPPLILLLKSYISERSFAVRINRTFSQTRPAKAGIAQGSILGPVLFNLYVNDIIKTTNTMICMYADDTAILSRHYNPNTLTQNINEHLAHLEMWFSVWKIAINTSKTEAISFSRKRPPPKSRSKTKGYPGLYTPNILVSLLIKTSRSDNILHTQNKLLIYTLILKPLLTYASPIWAHAARTNINLIESSQNVILRQILDAHWYMRNADIRSALKIPTIRQSIRNLAVNFFSNIDGHENPSIQEISHYPTYPFIRRPRDILVDPDFN